MKQLLRYLPIAALLVLVIALVWLLGTTSGLRWSFNRLTPMLPGEITVEAIDGRLIGPIEINGLYVQHPAVNLRVARLELDWTPIALLRGTLHLPRVYARDVNVQPLEQTKTEDVPGSTALPLTLRIDDGHIERLTLQRADAPLLITRVDIAGSATGNRIDISRLAVGLNQAAVTLQGVVTRNSNDEFDGKLQWSAHIAGNPPLEGAGTIRGNTQHIVFTQQLTAPAPVQITGELRQVDQTWRWSAELALERLALRQLRAQWPALVVSGRANGEGSFDAFRVRATVQAQHAGQPEAPAAQLQARLDWRPTDAALKVDWQGLAWPVAGKWLTSQKGELHARGKPSSFSLRTEAALRYDAVATGQLRATARGSHQRLQLDQLSLQTDGARLSGHGTWRPAGIDFTWNLDAANLARIMPTLAGTIVSQGRVRGTMQQPRIDATISGRRLAIGSNRIGAVQARVNIDAKTVDIDLTASAVDVGPATVDRVRLTTSGELTRHRFHVELVRGERRFELDADGAYAKSAWNGDLTQARLISERYGTWRADRAALIVRQGEFSLDTWCWHREQNRLCIGGRWNRAGPPANALSIRLTADMQDLSLIGALMPGVEELRGRLQADIRVDGTLAKPQLAGQATLAQASFRVPALGIAIKDIEMQLREADANAFTVALRARSGDGSVAMNGRINVGARYPWELQLSINGDNFEVANTAEARVLASPSLELNVYPRVVRVTGAVRIPRANFQPLAGTGAVRPSPDAVIVGVPASKTPSDWAVIAKVRVILGDDVNVSGFKLNAKIAGEVTIQEQPGQPTLAQGELRVATGEYEVYGQKIQIERGRLVYTGGTIDDPGLDIRATRRIEDVLVGVEARGTLRSPRLQLVSEPAMSETDVLSYLLLGRPSNQATQSEGSLLYRAATGLGLSGGEALARRIGTMFGIRDVRIEQDEQNQTSLLFGAYLSPRLYISYGIGLFDAINTLRLRYQLSQHWMLQTKTGANSGIDLLYTIER